MTEAMTDLPPGAVLAETWEQCARHVEAGGIVEVRVSWGAWEREWLTPRTYRRRNGAPGGSTWVARRLVPGESAAPYPHTVTPDVPDGYEAVWLPSETVDEFDAGEDDRVSRGHVVAGAREAQARRGTTPAPPPVPSWPDGVLRDAANRLRWIANSGYIEDPGIKRIIRSWADELDATPAPPWPGAVLSGCVDEDGVPTWLAQAGQVRGEQVRLMAGSEMWMTCSRGWSAIRWVEVRAPRAVPVPETERVPWWEANDRELVDGLLCVENAMIREVGREGDRVYVCGYEDPDNPDEDDRGDWQRNYWYGRDGFDGTVEVLVEAGQ